MYRESKTYQKPKNLKWRVICAGVENLIKEKGLKAEDVVLWVDWQSIYQDDKEEKMKGLRSLIKYATLCDYMLVPTEEEELVYFSNVPEFIPGYGERGWCRCEYFIFTLAFELRGREVPLYAIQRDGALYQYPETKVFDAKAMPSGGKLSNPADKACVQALEDKMIDAYGKGMVEWRITFSARCSVLSAPPVNTLSAAAYSSAADAHSPLRNAAVPRCFAASALAYVA